MKAIMTILALIVLVGCKKKEQCYICTIKQKAGTSYEDVCGDKEYIKEYERKRNRPNAPIPTEAKCHSN